MKHALRSIARFALVVAAIAVPIFNKKQFPNFSDFSVYVDAGYKMAAGHTVYDVVGHYQFKYAPAVAALLAGISKIAPLHDLCWVNWGFELAIFVVLLLYLGIARQISEFSWKRFAVLLGIVAALAIPLRDELKLGQVNLWCLLMLYASWIKSHRGGRVGGALLWACAISLKLFALILTPYWIFRKEWKLLAYGLVFHLLLNFGGVALFRGINGAWTENLAWLNSLTHSSVGLVGSTFDVSLIGVLSKVSWPKAYALAMWSFALFVYLRESHRASGIAFSGGTSMARLPPSLDRFFAISLAWILLLNPLVWPYWYLFLVFVFVPALDHPELFAGPIRVPRWAWQILTTLFIIGIHRHDTPLALGGVLTGLLGFMLLTGPRD
ncbi:MAG: glycosyltransferase family 87 protein [Bdellovibrionota bacterium]